MQDYYCCRARIEWTSCWTVASWIKCQQPSRLWCCCAISGVLLLVPPANQMAFTGKGMTSADSLYWF